MTASLFSPAVVGAVLVGSAVGSSALVVVGGVSCVGEGVVLVGGVACGDWDGPESGAGVGPSVGSMVGGGGSWLVGSNVGAAVGDPSDGTRLVDVGRDRKVGSGVSCGAVGDGLGASVSTTGARVGDGVPSRHARQSPKMAKAKELVSPPAVPEMEKQFGELVPGSFNSRYDSGGDSIE